MDVDEVDGRERPRAEGSWTPGKVAGLLGVSPVTLRTWAARYGVGPSLRDDGRHRRYSDADVRRLQHMQRLVDRGMRAREAAAAAFSGTGEAVPEVSHARRAEELERAAEELGYGSLAALLDETLDALGPAGAWTEVLVPVLRHLGGRWLRGDLCFASEWALTGEISLALQRCGARFATAPPGRGVLLACCPGERHGLPMEVLRAALAEAGIPAVHLGQMVPAETTIAGAEKLGPVAVFLWSMSAATADDLLGRRLRRRGFDVVMAGPGWENLAGQDGVRWVDDLPGALELAAERVKA
ncbi:MerR family DNA-binding transcriptional regulator [Amycolatopsis balhimycina DSM 5908]|uniref:MerR family DNA-binding transcriptional regulator n=1 Tax=Amycolatopsis balhimycina DSM 5908 TaxID=1081091 RepID=A0A428WNI2_AMYBA|nr:MerR family transcriptional regulator [Amycolatopsis balhimycina]RSM44588.1 MerR family DNA-binding transcriptional regulator [Amycolatopsis balhimycina DSM 5908]